MLSQKIIVMRQFYQQAHDQSQSEKAFEAIRAEMKHLQEISESEDTSLFAYLKNQNGKKLKGHEHQFKYRMNGGDRIFYTYGEYIDGCPEEHKSSIFIYAYSKHDDQDRQKLPEYSHEPEPVTEEDIAELNIDEKVYFEDFDFNYISQHSFYVFDEDSMPKNLQDSDVYLSEEQNKLINEYASNPEPTLILGGAGTGKTVMELHLLHDFKSANPEKKCIYFTQSDALLRKAKDRYKYIVSEAGETVSSSIVFKNINDFCRDYLYEKTNFLYSLDDQINDLEFYEYIENYCTYKSQLKKLNINNYDLWSEIRGTIKGGLDSNWHRYGEFNMNDYPGDFVQILSKNNLISRNQKDAHFFYINNPSDFKNRKELFTKKHLDLFNLFCEKLESVDALMPLQTEENYLQVSGQNSTLQPEQRTLIYKIACEYQDWINKSKKYDDNDLVLQTLAAGISEEDKYDFIVIDEIQDYTELQVYTICQFAKNKQYMIMAGDEHQIINPTIFDEGRLRKLFYDVKNNKQLAVKKLAKNFRCPAEVVNIANKSTNLCMKMIASKGELAAEQAKFNSRKPFYMDYNQERFNKILESLLQKPNVVLLVTDDNERQTIINNFGKEKFESYNSPMISTVAEIKGMEYKYVVCFNLISNFADRWSDILNGLSKKQTRYRYYFNLFYVGITRSQQYLCVIEDEKNPFYKIFEQDGLSDFEFTDSTDEDVLCISQLNADSSDWFEMAKKEFESGNYTKAKTLLKNVPVENRGDLDSECDMYIDVQNKKYTEAAKLALVLEDNVILNRLQNEDSIPESVWVLKQILFEPNTLSKDLIGSFGSISKLIDSIFNSSEEIFKQKVRLNIIKKFGDFLLETGDETKKKLEEING